MITLTMRPRLFKPYCILPLLVVAIVLTVSACSQKIQERDPPLVTGLDHIPIAVVDLERATEQYRKLGFSIKPGRYHENTIRNQHIKFPDGTEIELITATESRDALTAEYIRHLSSGDGAAFVGFYAPDMRQLFRRLDTEKRSYNYNGGLLTFPETDDLHYIFFGERNPSPTDQPKHFEHLNGAEALIGVWIAGDNLSQEREMFNSLGANISREKGHVPGRVIAEVARLSEAEVVFLPASSQLVSGRHIVGAVLRTNDIVALERVLKDASLEDLPVVETANRRSIFIPPGVAHGIWLEFRQVGDG